MRVLSRSVRKVGSAFLCVDRADRLGRHVDDEVLIKANEAFFEAFYLWYFSFCVDGETLFFQ
jgi:hypothetical protein